MAHTEKCFAIETGIDKLLVNDHRKMNDNIIRFQTCKQDRKAENKIKKNQGGEEHHKEPG